MRDKKERSPLTPAEIVVMSFFFSSQAPLLTPDVIDVDSVDIVSRSNKHSFTQISQLILRRILSDIIAPPL